MIIHALTEKTKPFVYLTTGLAFINLANHIDDTMSVVFDFREWMGHVTSGKFDTSEVDIFIFESVYLELLGLTVADVKKIYPNAKIVGMGSDTIYYITTGKNNGYQIQSPQDTDLFLETMNPCIDEYAKRGVNVDGWMWTLSEMLATECPKYDGKKWNERHNDFIGVYAPHTIAREGSYRNKMVNYLNDCGMNFTQGGGSGQEDQDVDKIFRSYGNSKFTLGTTSHDNPAFHGMKGFRDWIGPFMGSLLIYDDYPEVIEKFGDGDTLRVPIYGYGRFDEILNIHAHFAENQSHYNRLLREQRTWALENTIEKQLVRLFKKHEII